MRHDLHAELDRLDAGEWQRQYDAAFAEMTRAGNALVDALTDERRAREALEHYTDALFEHERTSQCIAP